MIPRGRCPHNYVANGGEDMTSDVCLECVLTREGAALARIAALEQEVILRGATMAQLDRRIAELEGLLRNSAHIIGRSKDPIEIADTLDRMERAALERKEPGRG